MSAEKQRVAIVGCGYVGTALGAALVQSGHEVVGTRTTPDGAAQLLAHGITPQSLRLSDIERLHQVLASVDAVVLCAAAGGGGDYRTVYLDGARSVVTALRGTRVRRLLYTSSTRVYGQSDGRWVDETSPTDPGDENGRVLVEAERVLLTAPRQTDAPADLCVTVVRLSGIVGPDRDLTDRARRLSGTQRNDGEAYVNLIHIDGIVSALKKLLPLPYHGVLNLSSDDPVTRRELYNALCAAAHVAPIDWTQSPDTDGFPSLGKRVGNRRVKKLLNLTLSHPVTDLIRGADNA